MASADSGLLPGENMMINEISQEFPAASVDETPPLLAEAQPTSLFPKARSVRVLCLDGGGIKGFTELLILKRIFRQLRVLGHFIEEPRPCQC